MNSITIVVIIVVVVVVAVAYTAWLQSTTTAQLHNVEVLDVKQSYIEAEGGEATIHILVHNRGPREATITTILVNNRPIKDRPPIIIPPGEKREITIETGYEPGAAIRVDLVSAKGNTYTIMLSQP